MNDLADDLAAQIHMAGLPEPVREHRFHPTRRWRMDLAWVDRMICFECAGMVWGGRHTRGTGFVADAEKYNTATLLGWQVYRVTADMIRYGTALKLVEAALGLTERR